MTNDDLVRAWKDPEFRGDLPPGVAHPAGEIEFDSDPTAGMAGGATTWVCGVTVTMASNYLSCHPGCDYTAWGTCICTNYCSGMGCNPTANPCYPTMHFCTPG